LQRRQSAAATRDPLASFSLVEARCGAPPARAVPITAGPWTHAQPLAMLPAWVPCEGYAGLVHHDVAGETLAVARGVAWIAEGPTRGAVIVDIPVDAAAVARLREETGITIYGVTPAENDAAPEAEGAGLQGPGLALTRLGEQMPWPVFIPYRVWDTGASNTLMVQIRLAVIEVYNRLSTTPGRFGELTFGQVMLFLLVLVAALFLVIQMVAFLMGLGLARSITGAIHELFIGTERVRRGDFSHRITIHTRDQLGELSMLFNSMTDSIEDLLQGKAEKERMEQELRIARQIQMSLLPQATFSRPGLGLMAHCEPAREVGGDYYDFLPVGDAVGILIADVSGKGTSAALYMAELKGLVLALSQQHMSPRTLLIDANRIISQHLDSRSFITVSYVLVDMAARTLQYSRAGHCPMLYVPGPYAVSRTPQVLAPDGMVLGLTIDDGTMFNRLLDEVTLPLGPGDLFLLYTDGMSEAMNADGDCFGDDRLAAVVAEHADLPSDELLARILEQVTEFAGSADQQDDMTMVLIRVEESGVLAVATPAAI
jgi:sigma-B regulation protein RsbU (phosphoserine phosphatase)